MDVGEESRKEFWFVGLLLTPFFGGVDVHATCGGLAELLTARALSQSGALFLPTLWLGALATGSASRVLPAFTVKEGHVS